MEFKNLIYEQENGLGIITLNRPKAFNALNEDLTFELGELASVLNGNQDLRVLIITGGSRVFAAGADIIGMMNASVMDAYRQVVIGHRVFDRLENLQFPTIAAINGPCLGGGCELSMCCDFRIAGEGAVFGLPEVSLGIIPGCGGTQRLAKLIGQARAKEMIYLCDTIKASKALEYGLVNKVVADELVMEEAKAFAVRLIQKPGVALRFAKEAVNCGVQYDFSSGKGMELSRFSMAFSTEDQKEGMKAFAEKRKAQYKNK
ncbi:MAG TPA: enoyl-CoA hydratase-related protein [Syntrophomonas sp.]|jgi:enoyl-CoA hydratase|nr:enoyl-CoA hydratase-related protein [Syntrophomonas sp.]